MVWSVLLVVLIVTIGTLLTLFADVPLRLEERIGVGTVTGVLAVSAASFVGFELFGMSWAALGIGLAVPGAVDAIAPRRRPGVLGAELASARRRLGRPSHHASSLRPLLALTVVTVGVTTRVFSLAYQDKGEGISAGSLAIWGDWAAHLAYAGSFAYGDNRALDLPLATGEGLRYHFLANYFGSLFTVTGLELPQALVWSAWLVAITVPLLIFSFVLRLSGSRLTAVLSIILFTLAGGIGAWYLIADVQELGWSAFTALPQTYARMPQHDLWVDNTISASLYAQRSTLLGVATGLSAGVLLLASRPRWQTSGFVFAGVLIGTTGISHVHMLATAGALGGLALLADRRRPWLWFLVPAAVIGLPLALAINPPTSALRWFPGWMAGGAEQSWPWFWLRNVGLLLPVFLAVSLFGGVPRRLRRLSTPLWLWFIVPNLVAFHPSEWNNTKFFLFWQFAGCVVIADLLRGFVSHVRHRHNKLAAAGAIVGATVVVMSLTVTGALDTLRVTQRDSAIPWVDDDEVTAARWLRDSARTDDVLVYGASNTSAVAALSGVPAVSAYVGWTDDLGLPDAGQRALDSRTILAGGEGTEALVDRYGVDYVVIGPRERYESDASDSYWNRHGTLVFSQGDYQIYQAGPPAG